MPFPIATFDLCTCKSTIPYFRLAMLIRARFPLFIDRIDLNHGIFLVPVLKWSRWPSKIVLVSCKPSLQPGRASSCAVSYCNSRSLHLQILYPLYPGFMHEGFYAGRINHRPPPKKLFHRDNGWLDGYSVDNFHYSMIKRKCFLKSTAPHRFYDQPAGYTV